MTQFFLAGMESDGEGAEAAYSELRKHSEIAVGCAARPRRIFKLDCRLEGRDCEIEVGRPMPHSGDVVVAILDHGREEAFVCPHPRRCGPSDACHTSGLRGDRLLLKTQVHMPTDHLDDLREKAKYARERYQLYKAKAYGQRPTSPARLRELQRAYEQSEQRLRFAEAQEEAAANEGDSAH